MLHRYFQNAAPSSGSADIRVLLIDDNRDMIEALSQLLSMKGFQTETANDGESGLILAQSYRPGVIVLDLGLPDLNGYEVLKKMRNMEEISHAKFIALTGNDDQEKSLQAGFDHHIIKPFDIEALSEWISGNCAGNR